MSLFDRLRQLITPDCGHAAEIVHLRNQAAIARLDLAIAEVDRDTYVQSSVELPETVFRLRAHRDLLDSQLHDAAARERELLEQIEEQTTRITYLEVALREASEAVSRINAAGGTQTSFAPPEAGGESPIAGDVVISDLVQELAYRLVGIYFEGRHHWLLSREDIQVKAPIHDKEFLERMRRGEEKFIAGDTLLADFRVVSFRASDGAIYAEHSVEKVKRIIHPDEQVALPLAAEVAHV